MPVTLGDGATPKRDVSTMERVMLAMTHGDGTFGKWGTVIIVTLGMVLLVIGANMPSFAMCVVGVAILAVIGTIRFVMYRHGHSGDMAVSDADYRRDLIATLNGYGLDDKYDASDIDQATASFVSGKSGKGLEHRGEETADD